MGERMIGVFGKRELEMAATRILDDQWQRPYQRVDTATFNAEEQRGFALLSEWGWIVDGIPTPAFWGRVHGR